MPDLRRPSVCRACGTPDQTAAYREVHCVVLCAECNVDWTRSIDFEDQPCGVPGEGKTLVCFPEPRPQQAHGFAIVCGGGR